MPLTFSQISKFSHHWIEATNRVNKKEAKKLLPFLSFPFKFSFHRAQVPIFLFTSIHTHPKKEPLLIFHSNSQEMSMGSDSTWVGRKPMRRIGGMSDALSIASDLGFSLSSPPSQVFFLFLFSSFYSDFINFVFLHFRKV